MNSCGDLQLHARIAFVGAPISMAIVYVAGVKYVFDSPVEAVEACMAAYLALNIKYPDCSKRVWYFLQKYVFRISTESDVFDPAAYTLANDISLS